MSSSVQLGGRPKWHRLTGIGGVGVALAGLVASAGIVLGGDWAHTWGGSSDDSVSEVAMDASGNAYFAGVTSSFGAGGQDVLLLKYDPAGDLMWSRSWGGGGNEYANGVAVDSSGNVYVVGGTSSFGAGWYDVFLLKFSSSGTLLWSRTWGGSSYEVGYDLAFDAGGNIYVAAESYSLGNRAVLLKFDPNGNLLATHTWKGPATYDSAFSVAVDQNGNVVLAGISWDYSQFPPHNSILLLKFDNLGNFLWHENLVSGAEDQAWGSKAVRFDSGGNIYVTGNRAVVCGSPDFSTCDFDAELVKLDPSGALIWARSWGGTGVEWPRSLAFDQAGDLVITGSTQSFLGGTSAAMLLKYDPSGNLLVSRIWGGNGSVSGWGDTLDTAGGILLAGSAPNALGKWYDVVASTSTLFPTLSAPASTIGTSSFSPSTPSGTVTMPTGVIDSGGRGADALLIRVLAAEGTPKPVVVVVPGIGASTLRDSNGVDQWLSCDSILSLHNGALDSFGSLISLHYSVTGVPATTLSPAGILTQYDSISNIGKPATQSIFQCTNNSGLQVDPTILINDVVCSSVNFIECAFVDYEFVHGQIGTTDIQNLILSHSDGAFLQFNDPSHSLLAALAEFSPQPWAYDFRLDIGALADSLHTEVEQVAQNYPGRPIVILTHSMGGLVTAAMIAQHPDSLSLLSHVISLGSPFGGGVTTYLYAAGFRAFAPFLSTDETKLLGANWTSVYELLPQWVFVAPAPQNVPSNSDPLDSIYQGCAPFGCSKPSDLPGLSRGTDTNLQILRNNVWNEIKNLGTQVPQNGADSQPFWNTIIGYNQSTPNKIVNSSSVEFDQQTFTTKPCYVLSLDDGDGEVPLDKSAQVGSMPSRKIYVQEKHAMLPKNDAVIQGIVHILNGSSPLTVSGLMSEDQFSIFRAFQPFSVTDQILINSCSPITLSVTDSAGNVVNSQLQEIQNAKYTAIGEATQVELPWDDTFTITTTGTGTGTFDLIIRAFGGQHAPLGYMYKAVPVKSGSQGTLVVGGSSVPTLQYDYAGKGVIDSIPANANPPTIVCTGCYFMLQGLRATFAFNVGYQGGVSTFSFNYRNSTQTVQFVSTRTSQISVAGSTATFSGQGSLNGSPGYAFTVNATDGGGPGSGLDNAAITITGPNSYLFTANGTVAGGDIIIHP